MAEVKKLVIGHFSSRYNELGVLLKEASLIFPETELASEGKIFEL
jgi:ribonuclease Z